MKFYGREQESESLEKIWAQSFHTQRYAEIDLIAVYGLDRQVTVAEVKRNRNKIDLQLLKEKVKQIKPLFPRYKIQTLGLSLEDV